MLLDFCGCWIVERGLKAVYSDYRPKDIADRRPDQVKVEEDRRRIEAEEKEEERERELEKRAAEARKVKA